jgi:UDP-GlcNAc:undecaprenyl-phosphate GlcNAc-1-phosphate transferase
MLFDFDLLLRLLGIWLFSTLLTLLTGFLSLKVTHKLGILDVPGSAPHKQHETSTPIGGGLALILSLAIAVTLLGMWRQPQIQSLILPVIVVFIFGLWDDARGLSASQKLIGQTIAAGCLILLGTRVRMFEYSDAFFGGSGPLFLALDYLVTFVWLVGITNAYNLVDSMDGIVVGLSGWASGFFIFILIATGQTELALFCTVLLGCIIGLTFYNVYPARMFLGDSGAQTIGFILAAIAILYTPVGAFQESSWFVPILIFGVPIFDTGLVIFSRLRRKQLVSTSHLDHTYHRLIKLGLSRNHAVIAMHISAQITLAIGFIALYQEPLIANIIFFSVIFVGFGLICLLDQLKYWP